LALVRVLDEAYAECPPNKRADAWETERIVLLYSAIGWKWYWSEDTHNKVVGVEVPFEREVFQGYTRRGIIDQVIRNDQGNPLLGEHKSTSRPIDTGSDYWERLRKDGQISMYIIEARQMQLGGALVKYGITPDDPLISEMLYDVWKKPTIRPKFVSQAKTKKLIEGVPTDDGLPREHTYFDESFEVLYGQGADGAFVSINGHATEIKWGAEKKPTKKNPTPDRPFEIKETPEMYGARLLDDMYNHPEKYFARKSIARTDKELACADEEFTRIARAADLYEARDLWFKNTDQCNAMYKCTYCNVCWYDLDTEGDVAPEGFKFIGRSKR